LFSALQSMVDGLRVDDMGVDDIHAGRTSAAVRRGGVAGQGPFG
jgi:hypothetical protein